MPFDRDNLAEFTGLPDRKLDKYLTKLVDKGVLGVEADGGEINWTVRGSMREAGGPETLERFARIQKLRAEAKAKVARQVENRRRRRAGIGELPATDEPEPERDKTPEPEPAEDSEVERENRSLIRAGAGVAKGALGLIAKAAAPLDSRKAKKPKSLAMSAGLSLLGPLGWLYAGSLREAVPASLLYIALAAIIPNALLWPVLWFALPVSALVGLAYGWQHNSKGQRTPLFLGKGEDKD